MLSGVIGVMRNYLTFNGLKELFLLRNYYNRES